MPFLQRTQDRLRRRSRLMLKVTNPAETDFHSHLPWIEIAEHDVDHREFLFGFML
jgi:hypothetical protein